MSETDNQFRALIDRILRSREAEDEAKQDTKEIYAEAKSSGYDKTAMGALVRELRSKDKNPAKFEEKSATLDLYRDAYERASHVHAREGRRSELVSQVSDVVSSFSSVDGKIAPTSSQPAGNWSDEIPAPIPQSSAPTSSPAETTATGTTPLVPVATPFNLRPHCRHPANCAGYGSNHCHSCKVALASSEVA